MLAVVLRKGAGGEEREGGDCTSTLYCFVTRYQGMIYAKKGVSKRTYVDRELNGLADDQTNPV